MNLKAQSNIWFAGGAALLVLIGLAIILVSTGIIPNPIAPPACATGQRYDPSANQCVSICVPPLLFNPSTNSCVTGGGSCNPSDTASCPAGSVCAQTGSTILGPTYSCIPTGGGGTPLNVYSTYQIRVLNADGDSLAQASVNLNGPGGNFNAGTGFLGEPAQFTNLPFGDYAVSITKLGCTDRSIPTASFNNASQTQSSFTIDCPSAPFEPPQYTLSSYKNYVKNLSGTPLVGAFVTLANTATGESRTLFTLLDGGVTWGNVPLGTYAITAGWLTCPQRTVQVTILATSTSDTMSLNC